MYSVIEHYGWYLHSTARITYFRQILRFGSWYSSSGEPQKIYWMLQVFLNCVFSVFVRIFTLLVICLLDAVWTRLWLHIAGVMSTFKPGSLNWCILYKVKSRKLSVRIICLSPLHPQRWAYRFQPSPRYIRSHLMVQLYRGCQSVISFSSSSSLGS